MPLGTALLLGAERLRGSLGIELLVLDRADGADLGIVATQLAFRIEDWVNMEPRSGRAPRQFTETQNKLLLLLVGQAILSTEEDDAALRDWSHC